MELTTYLSQVLGLFLIVVGASVLLRRSYYVPVIGSFVEERMVRMLMGIAELATGLFLVIAHHDWSTLPASIITGIGYLLVIEGTAYLLLPDSVMSWAIRTFNVRAWYAIGGSASIVLGAYLAAAGFGII